MSKIFLTGHSTPHRFKDGRLSWNEFSRDDCYFRILCIHFDSCPNHFDHVASCSESRAILYNHNLSRLETQGAFARLIMSLVIGQHKIRYLIVADHRTH